MGVAADAVSAPATRRCSRSLSQLPIVASLVLFADQRSLDLSIVPNNVRVSEQRIACPFDRALEGACLV